MFNVFACGLFDAKCEESVWQLLYTFLIPTLLAIGIGLAIISFLVAAISYITSAGDTKATEEATQKLMNSAIGLAIVLTAFLIVQLIISITSGGSTFNYTPISDTIKGTP